MPARSKFTPKNSSAHRGFVATAWRVSAYSLCKAILRSLEGNRWHFADSRGGGRQPERSGTGTQWRWRKANSPAELIQLKPGQAAKFAWLQHFTRHLALHTAIRDSATLHREASPMVGSEAKENMAGFVRVLTASPDHSIWIPRQ